MIKMISGVYGMPVLNGKGETVSVKRVGPEYGPFTLSAEQEARLVSRGVAVCVEPVVTHEQADYMEDISDDTDEEEAGDIGPIGFDDVPEEGEEAEAEPIPLDELSAKELRAMGAEYGLTFKGNASKAYMIDAIAAAQAIEAADDGEDAPTFDASEAVL